MQRTARVCYIYIGAYSFEALTRSMRNKICYAQNTRLDGFMTSLFFSPFLLCSYFYIFFHFIGTEKKCFFCLLYVPSHTRIAHRALQFRWFTCILSDYQSTTKYENVTKLFTFIENTKLKLGGFFSLHVCLFFTLTHNFSSLFLVFSLFFCLFLNFQW